MGSNKEADVGSITPNHNPVPERQPTKRKRIELRSKAVHELLAGVVSWVLPIVAPHSINLLKVVGLRTTLEEK